ncbi:MAG: tRNA (guanosine(46)-N7)-methyltransferase TrmB [Eubacteriales bacterium]
MRLRNITGADDVIIASEFAINEPKQQKDKWKELFGNDNPIHIEVGMGKGKFMMGMAKAHPNVNYIGIEKYSSVLLRAIQKMEEAEISNLRFILLDAKEIGEVFGEEEIDKIYLNFSDPWPKDRHAKRRLPSRQFLEKFNGILKKEGVIEFKTDNKLLFDFAVEEVEPAGWKIEQITYDLHHDGAMNEGNIMTEYEEKFSAKGNPIHKYVISR